MIRILTITGLVVLTATSAFAARSKLKDPMAGYQPTGETVSCIPMRSTTIKAIDNTHLLFRVSGSEAYLNTTENVCPRADSNFTRFDIRHFGTRLCEGEFIRVVQLKTGQYHGTCTLGKFEKLGPAPQPSESADNSGAE
ncbi:MAG: hypothetical protein R3C60_07745 [Parvularculaceae bacterium]